MSSYDYAELRAAVAFVRECQPTMMVGERDAIKLLADYVEATLDLADEVDGREPPT